MNPDAFRHKILSLARLPIPTPPHDAQVTHRIQNVKGLKKLTKVNQTITHEMIDAFIASRRQCLSTKTLTFYHSCLSKAIGIQLCQEGINEFLSSLDWDLFEIFTLDFYSKSIR